MTRRTIHLALAAALAACAGLYATLGMARATAETAEAAATSLAPAFSAYYSQPANGALLPTRSSQAAAGRYETDYDQYIWDDFTLGQTRAISEIHWRGIYHDGGYWAGRVTGFLVAFYSSTAGDTEPNVAGAPLAEYTIAGPASESPPWVAGSVLPAQHDYQVTLPTPFTAAAGVKYWINIEALQSGVADWGIVAGSGGNGAHFNAKPGSGGDFQFSHGSGDAAFTLGGPDAPAGPLASITVSPNPATVQVGAAQSFSAAGFDAVGNSVPITPTWSTDAGSIAGNVLTAQTAPATSRHVTATVGGIRGAAAVTVVAGPLAAVTVSPNVATVPVGSARAFTAAGADAYGNPLAVTPVWSTNAGSMAGNVLTAQTAPAAGLHVTAAVGGIRGAAAVTVVAGPLAAVTVSPAAVSLAAGATQSFAAAGADAYGNPLAVSPVWNTNAGSMTGNVLTAQTAPAAGLHVTATVGGIRGAAAVTVVAGPLHRLALSPASVVLRVGAQQRFAASAFDAYDNPVSAAGLAWGVALPAAGSIDAGGLFTAGARPGRYPAAVTVSSGAVAATADVEVVQFFWTWLPGILSQ